MSSAVSPGSHTLNEPRLSWWRRVSVRVIGVVILSMMLALLSIGVTLFISWQLEGNAAAINDAGSLRMRSYRIGLLIAESQSGQVPAVRTRDLVQDEMGNIEAMLVTLDKGDPARPLFIPRTQEVRNQLRLVRQRWHETLAPAAIGALEGGTSRTAALHAYRKELDAFVQQINKLVSLLESANAANTLLLRSSQLLLVGMAIAGTVAFIYLMLLLVVRPLLTLKGGIERMAGQDFAVRLPVETQDEFGDVAQGFNDMADRLQDLYTTLESKVEEKTRKLAEQNNETGFLYEMTAWLQEIHGIEDLCRGFLDRVQGFFGADGGTVRLVDTVHNAVHLVVHSGVSQKLIDMEYALPMGKGICGHAVESCESMVIDLDNAGEEFKDCRQCAEDGFRIVSVFPIRSGSQVLGFFNLHFREQRVLTSGEQHLVESLGRHLGVALENIRLQQHEREHAVAEERNLVAQGLHDSIAQGLNFLRLQTQMLEDSLRRGNQAEVNDIIPMLRMGIQESYEDVRELLLNFRTRLEQQNLMDAARLIVDKFERQTSIKVSLADSGTGAPLTPEEQLQVLFILQEALSNIRKHAHASLVVVRFDNDQSFRMVISDNGVGFSEDDVRSRADRHVGLAIMKERAARIQARLDIHSSPGEGVTLELDLPQRLRRTA